MTLITNYKNFNMINEGINNRSVQFENRTNEHYEFISNYFKPYMSLEEFLTVDYLKVVVMRINNEIVGLTLLVTYNKKVSKVKIVYTIIKKEYRNKGLNQELLNFVFNYAKDIRYEYVIANIRESNKSSLNSFLKYGFVISRKKGVYESGEKKIRVFKKINYDSNSDEQIIEDDNAISSNEQTPTE